MKKMGGSEDSVDSNGQEVDCPKKKIKLNEAENVQSVEDHHVLAENGPKTEEGAEEKVDMAVLNGENPEQILLCIPDMREKILDFLSEEDMRNFRLVNSVWNNILSTHMLKEETSCLQQFEIDLNNCRWSSVNLSKNSLPTWVSAVYGFSTIPGLKVTIVYNSDDNFVDDIQPALASVAPYVTLVHSVGA